MLALHALACVAGFIAGLVAAAGRRGLLGRLAQAARAWPGRRRSRSSAAATLFSLGTQAYALGTRPPTLRPARHLAARCCWSALTPHALPELFALFLPLAAWTLASRRGAWNELLAATFVTTAVAVPLLLLAATVETWITPRLLLSLRLTRRYTF